MALACRQGAQSRVRREQFPWHQPGGTDRTTKSGCTWAPHGTPPAPLPCIPAPGRNGRGTVPGPRVPGPRVPSRVCPAYPAQLSKESCCPWQHTPSPQTAHPGSAGWAPETCSRTAQRNICWRLHHELSTPHLKTETATPPPFPQIFLTWLFQAGGSRNEPWLHCSFGDCAPLRLSLGVFRCCIFECLTWQGQQGWGLRNKTPDTGFPLTLLASVMLK